MAAKRIRKARAGDYVETIEGQKGYVMATDLLIVGVGSALHIVKPSDISKVLPQPGDQATQH